MRLKGVAVVLLAVTVLIAAVAPPDLGATTRQAAPAAVSLSPQQVAQNLGVAVAPGVSPIDYSKQVAKAVEQRGLNPQASGSQVRLGLPNDLGANAAFSAAVATTVGGRGTQFDSVELLADLDGREDCFADHEAKVDDFSTKSPVPGLDFLLTRVAVSEHTIANGYDENVFYYGDSVGNVYVAYSNTFGVGPLPANQVLTINLPTVLNAFGTLNSDDQIVVTGLAVNPVADLTSFANVNGAYSGFAGKTGEILYVSFWDTGSGFRLTSNGTVVRSGVLAFPIADVYSGAANPPGTISPFNFPVTVGGAFGVAFSVFGNLAGLAVDDDGSVYFQQVDLIQFTGANIVKITDIGSDQDRSLAISPFPTITTLNPTEGRYGDFSGPASQANRFTNYSGTATTFGNIAYLTCGPCNTVYAAVARSQVATDDQFTRNTEGPFVNPPALGATPSMIISFADCSGAVDNCTSPTATTPGILPVSDGFADAVFPGILYQPGVNNFRVFVLGTGPDPRGTNTGVFGTLEDTLKLEFQIDYTIHSGLVVDEARKVYVISGGTPAGTGLDPSPQLGEILCFEDICPADRRADYRDLHGDTLPNPPDSGPNVGNGVSNRFDAIFWQAPVDQITATPTGIAGLSRGFLLYLNRQRPCQSAADHTSICSLPNGVTQGDDTTNGPIYFECFDPSHQVAGGDDQNFPFKGDDSDGTGFPPFPELLGSRLGGFEFIFGATGSPASTCTNTVWNAFFLNSNGNISFGAGDTDNTPTIPEFRSGVAKIAPAWADLNPSSRQGGARQTFPVQALGFAGVNTFKVRWINVPEFGHEVCGSKNTFSIYLFDDGTLQDENAAAGTVEGPTDLRFRTEPQTGTIVGGAQRPDGTGFFCFEYCRMDLLGTPESPVLTGYAEGANPATDPPGLCSSNLSLLAYAADTALFRKCLIGEGTEPEIFEFFNTGHQAGTTPEGQIIQAVSSFDLRTQGNSPLMCTPPGQPDPNRGFVCFFGKSCPITSICQSVTPVLPVAVAPGQPEVTSGSTVGVINALCQVEFNIVGYGFWPNEATSVCTDEPTSRPGKTVTTAVTFMADTNGDGTPEVVLPLTNVTVVNPNLIRATLPPLANAPGTPFPLDFCGGEAVLAISTVVTSGDNNQFGDFTLVDICPINVGTRAPVVLSASPSGGDCATTQNVLLVGHCFTLPNGTPNVTSVFAVEEGNPGNVIQASSFTVLGEGLIDAHFSFGSTARCKRFIFFVSGPNGTSRNLTELPPNTIPGCTTLGNEMGNLVTFTCGDTAPPTIVCPPNVTVVSDTGSTVVVYPDPVASDDCGVASVVCEPPSGSLFPLGVTDVICTATDVAGNTATCTFTVTVTGTGVGPQITCPPNITIISDTPTTVVTYPTPTVIGGVQPVTLVCTPPSGSAFPTGATTVTCTATDAAGNIAVCSFTVTIVPSTGQVLTITCPPNITVISDTPTTVVTYPEPTISGGTPGAVAFVCTPPSGSSFPTGVTTVTCIAIDCTGQTAVCTFTITVVPSTGGGLTITCPANIIFVSDTPTTTVTYPDPLINGGLPGDVTFTCTPPSGSLFPIGVTTVTCTATDSTGQSATCTFTITVVPFTGQGLAITCPADITVGTDSQTTVVTYPDPTVTGGAVGPITLVCTPPSGSVFPQGTTQVTCTAVDASGATVSCTFNVTVGPAGPCNNYDLTGTWKGTPAIRCKLNSRRTLCCQIKGQITVQNIGVLNSPKCTVGFWLSNDAVFDPNVDTPLQNKPVKKLRPGQLQQRGFTKNLPGEPSLTGKFIIAVITCPDNLDCNPFNNVIAIGPLTQP